VKPIKHSRKIKVLLNHWEAQHFCWLAWWARLPVEQENRGSEKQQNQMCRHEEKKKNEMRVSGREEAAFFWLQVFLRNYWARSGSGPKWHGSWGSPP